LRKKTRRRRGKRKRGKKACRLRTLHSSVVGGRGRRERKRGNPTLRFNLFQAAREYEKEGKGGKKV